LKLVLEPIFESDFLPCSYGFRPNRRAHDAVAEVRFLASHSAQKIANVMLVLMLMLRPCGARW